MGEKNQKGGWGEEIWGRKGRDRSCMWVLGSFRGWSSRVVVMGELRGGWGGR